MIFSVLFLIGRASASALGVAAIGVFVLFTSLSNAETIRLQNGKRIEGRIIAETTQVVHLQTNLGVLAFRREEIRNIEYNSNLIQSPLRGEVESALSSNDALMAVRILASKTPLEPPDLEWADSKILTHWDLIERQFSTFPSSVTSALCDLLQYRTRPPPPHLLSAVIEMALRAEETTCAVQLVVRSVQRGWLTSLPPELKKHYFASTCNGGGQGSALTWVPLLDCGAALSFNRSKLGPSERDFFTDVVARVMMADAVLTDSSSTSDVAQQIIRYLSTIPEDERRATFYNVIRLAQDRGSTSALVHVCETLEDLVGIYQLPWDLSAVLREHHRVLLEANNFHSANNLIIKFEADYPDLMAELRLITEYREKRARLDEEDHYGRYQLAKWGLSMGLTPQAADEFRRLAYSPTCGEIAQLHLQVLAISEEAQAIRKSIELIRQQAHVSARREIVNLLKSHPYTLLSTETEVLVSLTKHLEKTSPELQKAKGISIIQHAERLALRGDYAQAATLLQSAELDMSHEVIRHALRSLHQRFPQLNSFVSHHEAFEK
ncbi:MAG: hypothetical protein N2Z21_06820 [Candidatus Sumerlaeaceae bacterium]|nr:hypothetical protein [Candidatus Sumerlaeaceae bacterium]